jgi:MFS family permease
MEQKEFKVGGKGAWGVFTVLTLLYMINRADLAIINVALQPIKLAFNLTDAQAGMLPSMATLGIALLGIPASIFGDRWARRKIVTIMGLIWSLFTFATGIVNVFWQMLTARFMVGVGEAGYATTGINWLSGSFDKQRRALIIALFWVGGQFGAVVGMIFGGMLVAGYGWQSPFYVFALPGIILAIIAFFLPDFKTLRKEGEAMLSKEFFKDLGGLFKVKSYWLIIISTAFYYFSLFAWPAWMPSLFMRAFNLPVQQAGMLYGITILALLVGSPLGGFLADRLHKRSSNGRPYYMIITRLIELVLSGAVLLLMDVSFGLFFAAIMLTTMMAGMVAPQYITMTTDVTPARLRTSAIGINNFIAQVTGATLGSLLVGFISDAVGGGARGIQVGLAWLLIASFLSLATLFILPRFYPKDCAGIGDEVLVKE